MREDSLGYQGWRVVGACSVAAFFATIPLNAFGVFLKPLCDHFSWPRQSASSAFAVPHADCSGVGTLGGQRPDRIGARRVIVPCLAVSGCAVVSLAAMTSSIWHLRLVYAVLGVVTMGLSPIVYPRAIFSWFDARRGQALGLMLGGAAMSGILLPPAAQMLIRLFGWRTAWTVLGLGTLLIALPVVVRYLHERRSSPTSDGTVQRPEVSVRTALRSRVFWTLAAVVFCGTVASSGALVHMVALLADRGVPASRAALAVSALAAASLAGRVVTGWLLDRFSAVPVSVLLLVILAFGMFLLAIAPSFGIAVLAAMCIGFGSGGELDITPYLLSRHFGLRSVATLYGFNWTAWGLASAAGPILMGRAFDATGSYAEALFQLGFVTLVAAGLMLTFPSATAEHNRPRVLVDRVKT